MDLWDELDLAGFSLTEQLKKEFQKPHHVTFLFDTEDECIELLKGLHGLNFVYHQVLHDAGILHKWSIDFRRRLDVDRREELNNSKRMRLMEPNRLEASEIYGELLGMNVKLQSKISKSTFRRVVANPDMSRQEVESIAREKWLYTLVEYLQEADLPICKVADSTSDPGAVLLRAFGSRRMKALRNRARAWKKIRDWLLLFKGVPFPRNVSDMMDYLIFLIQEGATRGRINETCAALSVLEDAGQVPSESRI